MPETEPPGCASAICEFGTCRYVTETDADEDHARAMGCTSNDPRIDIEPGSDCNDNDSDVSPERDELCNGVDDDCDGLTDFQNGTAYTKPPAPFSTLECSDGTWWVTSWHFEGYTSPASPTPLGPVVVTRARLYISPGNDPAVEVPTTLFELERDATGAEGDHVKLDLNFQVLAAMPSADRERVGEIFAASGILSLDADIEFWGGWGLAIPTTGAPFLLR
jgi:hypothetical protein